VQHALAVGFLRLTQHIRLFGEGNLRARAVSANGLNSRKADKEDDMPLVTRSPTKLVSGSPPRRGARRHIAGADLCASSSTACRIPSLTRSPEPAQRGSEASRKYRPEPAMGRRERVRRRTERRPSRGEDEVCEARRPGPTG
jgi:hypothetical protein